jgi:hypothetical protein
MMKVIVLVYNMILFSKQRDQVQQAHPLLSGSQIIIIIRKIRSDLAVVVVVVVLDKTKVDHHQEEHLD